jgi:nucleoside-diphosphate-sugar epimerase
MKKKFKLFCFGFGQVGKYFVNNLIKNKFNFSLITTNTTKTKIGKINNLNYKSYYFKDKNFDKNLLKGLKSANKVLISIPPTKNNDLVLKKFDEIFKKNKFEWVTYLSATSVYGNKMGKWVNETTLTVPTSQKGIDRLNAEKNWLKYFKEFNLPLQIFRLSGIYSNENNALTRLKKGKLNIVEKKNHFFSRIHVEDIAKILTISLSKFRSGQIFNISDDYPCPNYEIASYAAKLIKMKIPKKIKLTDVKNEMLRDFFRDSKKVSNNKMKIFFSYKLKYPNYKKGLRAIRNNIF